MLRTAGMEPAIVSVDWLCATGLFCVQELTATQGLVWVAKKVVTFAAGYLGKLVEFAKVKLGCSWSEQLYISLDCLWSTIQVLITDQEPLVWIMALDSVSQSREIDSRLGSSWARLESWIPQQTRQGLDCSIDELWLLLVVAANKDPDVKTRALDLLQSQTLLDWSTAYSMKKRRRQL